MNKLEKLETYYELRKKEEEEVTVRGELKFLNDLKRGDEILDPDYLLWLAQCCQDIDICLNAIIDIKEEDIKQIKKDIKYLKKELLKMGIDPNKAGELPF